MKRLSRTTLLWMFLFSCIFLIFNFLTPLFADDWNNLIYATDDTVQSIGDALKSGKNLYLYWSGRVIPHVVIQIFNCITGKAAFNVVNSIVFFFYLFAVLINVTRQHGISQSQDLFLLAISTFLILPGFSRCCLWLCGACNYMWVGVAVLTFNYLLQRRFKKSHYPWLFLLGLICGWSNEGIVMGFALAYVIFVIHNRKRISGSQKVMLTGFYLGIVLLVSSPANFHRFVDSYDEGFYAKDILINLYNFNNLRIVFLMLFACLCLCKKDKKKYEAFAKRNYIMLIAMLGNIVFIYLTRHTTAHSRFGIELCALIIMLGNLPVLRIKNRFWHLANTCLAIFLCGAIPTLQHYHSQYRNDVEKLQNGETVLLANDYRNIYSRFVLNYIYPVYDEFYDSFKSETWNVEMIARRLGAKPFVRIPESLAKDMVDNPRYDTFSTDSPSTPLFAMRANQIDISKMEDIYFVLHQKDLSEMNPLQRLYERYVNKNDLSEVQSNVWWYVKLNGQYYILAKKSQFEDTRVKDVRITYKEQ